MVRYLITIIAAFFLISCSSEVAETEPVQTEANALPMQTQTMRFTANGLSLSALLDTPAKNEAKALVIFVHGYGPTNVVEQNWYYDLRSRFAAQGVSSFVWDKPGQGDSEGAFDANQPVESSAAEVIAAAKILRDNNVPGSQKIGIWGVSRAGWIAPLAMSQDKNIDFWISVSGVDANESFGYLLQSNWRLKGYSEDRVKQLYNQWLAGNRIVAEGEPYATYLSATEDLRADPFMRYMSNGSTTLTEAAYNQQVKTVRAIGQKTDAKTGLAVYVEDFYDILKGLDVHTLAILGEKDSVVDWRSTQALYEETIGQNLAASLSIKTFPNGNHNLHKSETGSFEEMIDILNTPEMVDGYFDTIETWMNEVVFD